MKDPAPKNALEFATKIVEIKGSMMRTQVAKYRPASFPLKFGQHDEVEKNHNWLQRLEYTQTINFLMPSTDCGSLPHTKLDTPRFENGHSNRAIHNSNCPSGLLLLRF